MIGAVDIGGTKIAVGMVDDSGKVLSRMETPSDPNHYPASLEWMARALGETARHAGVEITGIGIGSTGPVDPMAGEFGEVDFLPGWRHKNLVNDLAQIFKVRVALENDGDAAALAEAGWGAGRNRSRLIYITVGTGIGGGIILDGKLYRGVDGAHPEVGHQVIDLAGPPCSCGFRGCWESLAAGPAMVTWLESHAPADYPHRTGITGKRICELARQGDALALQAVEHEGFYLGLGLANLVTLFTPDVIILSGSVLKSAPLFMDRIRAVIGSGCRFVPAEKTELMLASLGEDTNLIGAARVWHYRFGG
ncbi:Glucokinase [Candidatus Sulfotelmatobacter kueseliae]|uniref:Glucokinase n=1 Tax=Candidatus Sulfotelmatobacter kueseliae TaxID=2042962 RepID=A0A2U3L744_9BACT|nr:Glucokinase [Candidatus Sulfotelmatobacter kueseliae]